MAAAGAIEQAAFDLVHLVAAPALQPQRIVRHAPPESAGLAQVVFIRATGPLPLMKSSQATFRKMVESALNKK